MSVCGEFLRGKAPRRNRNPSGDARNPRPSGRGGCQNDKHFNRDLVETVRRGLSDSVKKLEKSTYLDTFNIDCSLEIDGVSFRHSFVKGDIRV